MAETDVNKRVSSLEKELESLKQKVKRLEKKDLPWWKQIIGTFANDPAHEEAMRLGREYRISQREDLDPAR
ncbi:MAG: hypothetical protein IT174_03910 [Acidobacteria bacterium]|nr:hypothetical protein [Acidobacteriota bacterium]